MEASTLVSLIRSAYEDMTCRVDSCGTTYRLCQCEDRSEAMMSSVTIPIPACHRQEHERLEKTEVGSSGHLRASWKTWTLRMTSLNKNGCTKEDVKARIHNAKVAFILVRKKLESKSNQD